MNWKLCTAAFASLFSLFPQNIIGCGAEVDPKDYFISFFSRSPIPMERELKPFFYTSVIRFYDAWDEDTTIRRDPILEEWAAYGKIKDPEAAWRLIYLATPAEVGQIVNNAKGSAATLNVAPSMQQNSLLKALLQQKNLPALEYLAFAKSTETFSQAPSDWENPVLPDSALVNGFIQRAEKLQQAATDPFLKTKYAYQKVKLLFYNRRYQECIDWFDRHMTRDTGAAVHAPARSYRAGSLFRLGHKAAAALDYARVFGHSRWNRRGTFMGFKWATADFTPPQWDGLLKLCRNKEEQAVVKAMRVLDQPQYAVAALREIHALDKRSPMIPLLAIREINKLEEQYLSPMLENEKDGKVRFMYFLEDTVNYREGSTQAVETIRFFDQAGQAAASPHRGLLLTGAAYLSYIIRDFSGADKYLSQAEALPQAIDLEAQQRLIRLLLTVSKADRLNSASEGILTPHLKWLIRGIL